MQSGSNAGSIVARRTLAWRNLRTPGAPRVGAGRQGKLGRGAAGQNRFEYGQCTYHAYERRPDIYDTAVYVRKTSPPGGWDGWVWADRARAAGFPVGTTPKAGALAVFSREYYGGPRGGGLGGRYGHVAYVTGVNGNGTFNVTERNIRGNPKITSGTYRLSSGIQFVYGGPAGGGPSSGGAGSLADGGDVFFIKTRNTGSGKIEAHSNSGVASTTRFSPAEHSNGWFGMWPGGDVWFVKTRNTGSGMVERHTVTRSSGYTTGMSATTRFSPADQSNGWFGMWPDGDVWFVKTKNTGSGKVEAHTQSGISQATRFSPGDADNGWFGMWPGGDVWFVKTKNTGSGKVEVHTATRASSYQLGISSTTRFSPADASNGWFGAWPNGDVYFVKTKNTGSGRVERHVVTQSSGFQAGPSSATRFSPGDADNGWFGPLP